MNRRERKFPFLFSEFSLVSSIIFALQAGRTLSGRRFTGTTAIRSIKNFPSGGKVSLRHKSTFSPLEHVALAFRTENKYTRGKFRSFPEKPMTRFLCFLLLFVLAFPMFAQEEPPASASMLPRDPALLMRMREQVSRDLQNTQRMLSYVNPNDTQLINDLTAHQADLSKQLREISEQMQAGTQFSQFSGMPPSRNVDDIRQEILPPTGRATIPSMMPPQRDSDWQMPNSYMPRTIVPSPYQEPFPNRSEMPVQPSYSPTPPMYGGQNWTDQDKAWDMTPWGPRLPKELTDMKQSIESLQKEVGELKDTIKALETQIQLLSRNILLNERIKENGN